MPKFVVPGVDGNFGTLVAKYVQEFIPTKDLIFTAPKEDALISYKQQGIVTAVADFNSPENLIPIFQNADKVLLISMPFVGSKRRQAHQNMIEACIKANVHQVIYTSVLSAANPLNPSIEGIDHGFTETLLENSPLDYIILRNSLFAEAFISDYLLAIQNNASTISKNMGNGKVAFVSRKDAAFAAACALNSNFLHRIILNINGTQSVNYQEFLDIGNQVTTHNISYKKQTDEDLYSYFDSIGVPRNTDGDFSRSPIKATSEGMVSFGTAIAQNFLDISVNDFPKLTGRQPLSLRYMFEHLDDFQLGQRHPTE
ncbi:MAG: NAD(P)H-binding protein [Lactobacillus sp.]|uniref:NAD(P)H-binding protein n=1 Tax=Bombilactobacillus bombi TaxID=1303590 RepID=UPI0035EF12B5|nr:NAD(P)H-binding protein [Lactobacillus sp.]